MTTKSRSKGLINSGSRNALLGLAVLAGLGFAGQAGAADPDHMIRVRALASKISPANNVYNSNRYILWADESTNPVNQTQCQPFVRMALEKEYGLTSDFTKVLLGQYSPLPQVYYDHVAAQKPEAFLVYDKKSRTRYAIDLTSAGAKCANLGACYGFERVNDLSSINTGDIVIIRYNDNIAEAPNDSSVPKGHMMFVSELPVEDATATTQLKASLAAGEKLFKLEVIDSSSSYHGVLDTRYRFPESVAADGKVTPDTGVGRGEMHLIASDGVITGYKWSTAKGSKIYRFTGSEARPLLVSRIVNY